MQVFDVTLPMRPEMVTWPDEPGPTYAPLSEILEGDPANVTHVGFGSHTGTHVDAPKHFLDDGPPVDQLDPAVLVGPAYVVDVGDVPLIDRSVLESCGVPADTTRLVIRSDNSGFWDEDEPRFHEDFTGVAPSGADWLVERGIRLVGIDYLSIEPFQSEGHPVHRRLLAEGVVIVEGLDLRAVTAGAYELFCGPLRLGGIDGSPARVFLVRA